MSHFSVLVPADSYGELEDLLMPYHEYECTGIEEYLEWDDRTEDYVHDWAVTTHNFIELQDGSFVSEYDDRFYIDGKSWMPMDITMLALTYKDSGKYESFEEFIEEYHGGEPIPGMPGRYGCLTNPNAKWDWWSVGGRWNGLLVMKEGRQGGMGEPGIFGSLASGPGRASIASAGDIDWDAMEQNEYNQWMSTWDECHEAMVKCTDDDVDAAEEASSVYDADNERGKNVRKAFPNKRDYALARAAWVKGTIWLTFDEWVVCSNYLSVLSVMADLFYGTKQARHEAYKVSALTYAFLDLDGEWNGGWFGMDDESRGTDNYDEVFYKFIAALPPDQRIYIVDAHI